MSNRDIYKDAMSGVRHSDDAVERIFDMTVDKKKLNSKQIFKRIGASALALAILAGGGFGVNQIVSSKVSDSDSKTVSAENYSNPLSVMIVYADEYELPEEFEMSCGNLNKQPVFYSIHCADANDEKAVSQLEELYEKDINEVESTMDKLQGEGYSSTASSGKSTLNSKSGEINSKMYVVTGGEFALSLDDYSNVKRMTIKNSSEYGQLVVHYVKGDESSKKTVNERLKSIVGNKVKISGDDLRNSQKSKVFECGTKHKVNKGYSLSWDITTELTEAVGNDFNFDLSQIKDTITFNVEFNDGTVQTVSLNLYFDSDGYMHFE